jgi:hypothetical protein
MVPALEARDVCTNIRSFGEVRKQLGPKGFAQPMVEDLSACNPPACTLVTS